MNEPKLCPFQRHDCIVRNYGNEPIAVSQSDSQPFNPCLRDKCAMWREAETIVQEQYIMVNRQVSPEIIRTDRYCGLAGKP